MLIFYNTKKKKKKMRRKIIKVYTKVQGKIMVKFMVKFGKFVVKLMENFTVSASRDSSLDPMVPIKVYDHTVQFEVFSLVQPTGNQLNCI